MHHSTIYARIKRVLAGLRADLGPSDIRGHMVLSDAPLRMTVAAKRALAALLTAVFEDMGWRITPTQSASAVNVTDLFLHFWKLA